MHSIKSYTAHRCNEMLGQCGVFWQQESYNHWVRDQGELDRIIAYIEQNPVKAGLATRPELWPYGSAFERHRLGMEPGVPLLRMPSAARR